MPNEEGSSEPKSVLSYLMTRRTVVLSGDMNHKTMTEFGRRLLDLQVESGEEEVTVLIDSMGGSIDVTLKACDLMSQVLTYKIRGIAIGDCGSAATLIMLYCDERISLPHSRFLIHSGSFNNVRVPINETTAKDLEDLLAESRKSRQVVVSIYMKKMDKTEDEVLALMKRGDQRFNDLMSPKEAKACGLIEKVTTAPIKVFDS